MKKAFIGLYKSHFDAFEDMTIRRKTEAAHRRH